MTAPEMPEPDYPEQYGMVCRSLVMCREVVYPAAVVEDTPALTFAYLCPNCGTEWTAYFPQEPTDG
ncbi:MULTISPECIES: hypothetical protein [Amycolatopsis]|uniref:Uncharacterized protein n=1 Tax=Amycolatopsis tucumanensis TaxID=401106 RepID=A0ABP7JR34_9PSEU|nr:hypothetical protein [Amycolatopsis tucumanensis]MCF6425070.1 hypothetical protein [Amycolatopsis tucumanensis]